MAHATERFQSSKGKGSDGDSVNRISLLSKLYFSDSKSVFASLFWTMKTMVEPVTHGPCGREVPIRAGGVMPCLPSMAPNLTEGQSTQGGEGEARGGGALKGGSIHRKAHK